MVIIYRPKSQSLQEPQPQNNNLKYRPEVLREVEKNDFLPPVSLWTSLGGLFLVGAFGVAVVLASVSKYNVTIKTAGNVRPAGELKIVQAAIEGVIKTIEVKENQVVRKGEAIAYIDDSQMQIQKSQLLGNIQLNKSQLMEVNNQLGNLDSQILAESNVTERTIASAKAELVRNEREYQDWLVRTQSEVQAATAGLQTAEVNLEKARTDLEFSQREQARMQQLFQEGVVPRRDFEQRQLNVKQAQSTVKAEQKAVEIAKAKLRTAKAALNPSVAMVDISKERIVQEKARGDVTVATLRKERSQLLQRRTEIENQVRQSEKDLQQITLNIKKTVIRANTDGTIINLALRNSSQVIRPGEAITQIVPRKSALMIKARVPAEDIAKVTVCKEAEVAKCKQGKVQLRFSAYPFPDFGSIKGAVRAISADAITSDANGTNATPFYEVTIQPEKMFLKDNPKNNLQSGMEATVDIISREETALMFILRRARWVADL
jgi:HlyD family secretion protein